MTIGTFVSWVVCGLVVGWIARAIVPGRQSLSLPMTSLLGIRRRFFTVGERLARRDPYRRRRFTHVVALPDHPPAEMVAVSVRACLGKCPQRPGRGNR